MEIIQPRDNFKATDKEALIKEINEIYSYGGYKPQIKIEGDLILIHLDSEILRSTQKTFDKANMLCNAGRYAEAVPLYKEIIKTCPLHVDALRSLAQTYMMLKDLDKAIDYNLEALRIDAGNLWALILMGNIFSMKDDQTTAMEYYKKVLTYHPNDVMAVNNIGGIMLKQNKPDEAITYFQKAKEIDPTYMNLYYGMAMAYDMKSLYTEAWESAREGIMKSLERHENPQLLNALNGIYFLAASNVEKTLNTDRIIADIIKDIKEKYNETVVIEKDNTISVCAKLQYSKSAGRDHHVIKYDNRKNHHAHLIVHEFMHLYLMLEASRVGKNRFIITDSDNDKAFDKRFGKFFENLSVRIGRKAAAEYKKTMFSNFVLYLMNGPLDLYVEERMFRNYPSMRPLQMLSLCEMQANNIRGMEEAMKNPGNFPNDIVFATKILNIVSAMQVKEMFGLNYIDKYKPTNAELEQAEMFYDEFKADIDYSQAQGLKGEEYNYMMYVISELGFKDIVKTINEKDYVLPKLAKTEDENADFSAQHKDDAGSGETAMMSMYMFDALQFFEGMSNDAISGIAIEIAMLGMGGINPDKKSGYKVRSIPSKDFGGYELLAYYYVSWALAIPEQLEVLKLPFKNAYDIAVKLFKLKKK